MKFEKGDFSKFVDIAKKRPRLYIAMLIGVPILLIGFYLLFPGHYSQEFKVRLSSKLDSLIDEDPVEALLTALGDERLFTDREIEYLGEFSHLKENGSSSFTVIIEGKDRAKLQRISIKATEKMQEMLGRLTRPEIEDEEQTLKGMIERQEKEKASIEEYLKTVDENEFKGQKGELSLKIDALTNQLSLKKKQLEIIEEKVESLKSSKDRKAKIFEAKSSKLSEEITALNKTKNDLDEQYSEINTFSTSIQEKLQRIVFLEKSIGKSKKKLSVLGSIDSLEDKEYIKIPYLYQASIVIPPGRVNGIYERSSVLKRSYIGVLIGALLILFAFLYYLIFNPVICNTRELEKFANLPVIGAISDLKRGV